MSGGGSPQLTENTNVVDMNTRLRELGSPITDLKSDL